MHCSKGFRRVGACWGITRRMRKPAVSRRAFSVAGEK